MSRSTNLLASSKGGIATLLFLAVLVASCSSTPTASTSTTSTSSGRRTTTAGGPILGPDGLSVVAVGRQQTDAVSAVTQYLGQPTSTGPGACAHTTEVDWGDLSLEFTSGTFTGYRYLPGGLAAVGKGTGPIGPGSPLLHTSTGATLGMTLAQVRGLYPADDLSSVQGGAIVVQGSQGTDRLFLGFFARDASTPLTEIKGGSPCGDF